MCAAMACKKIQADFKDNFTKINVRMNPEDNNRITIVPKDLDII